MRIFKLKTIPSTQELAETLKEEFSDQYSYGMFGLDCDSIIVSKSIFVGVQISKKNNEITLQGMPASVPTWLLYVADLVSTGGIVSLIFRSSWIKFENEIRAFLIQKYNQEVIS
ncbi:hypothetical protein [Dyadobacter sp. NIV53]|uniref:hypothetical protein n=1 Tax=Dyadobacter sp. NIV53 TaxID=2861765 RepID=UPI001C885137|nr:hypothetical protein [Dyadobacter sp. NIV53]